VLVMIALVGTRVEAIRPLLRLSRNKRIPSIHARGRRLRLDPILIRWR
jgi:hypothetical protein